MKHAVVLVIMALLLAACPAEQAPLVADEVVIRKPGSGMQMSAGYFTLHNNTRQAITITRVTSPGFEAVEMHESVLQDGISRMIALDGVTIPARQSLAFEPGGKHLMLMRPVDDADTVTLDFHAGPTVVLTLDVRLSD